MLLVWSDITAGQRREWLILWRNWTQTIDMPFEKPLIRTRNCMSANVPTSERR